MLEDFLITRHKRNKRFHYKANPVVKDNMGRLYCLFLRDNLSFYTSIVSCGVNGVAKADIIRNDGSKVKIGDTVALYITDSVNNAGLQVNDDKTYRIYNRSHKFRNVNPNNDISALNRISFMKGLINVELNDDN